MRLSILTVLTAGAAITFAMVPAILAAEQEEPSNALTIYSTAQPGSIPPELYRPIPGSEDQDAGREIPGYAMVRQEREISIGKERDTIRFTDVAARIDPTTVSFTSLTDPGGTRVLEQNYEFDLVSAGKLMNRFIDQKIELDQVHGNETKHFTGKLLSTTGGVVIGYEDGTVRTINGYAGVTLPKLPGGLITRPTLVWNVVTGKPGPHRARVGYQTSGVTWWADYNATFSEGKDANSGLLDFGAWVSIINRSGAGYPDAKLKLIAGDVQRVAPAPRPAARMRVMSEMAGAPRDEGFEEKAFFEYHLYTLGRPTTLPDNSTKQIELFPAAHEVPCEKVLVYYGLPQGFRWFGPEPAMDRNFGNQSNKKVDIYLRFKNDKEHGMGMPLPSGRIRVSKMDPADKSLEFIGEDKIDHTPKDEEVLIRLGSAFDVVGERRQVDFKMDARAHTMDETIEIKIRNHKDQSVKVLAKENLYRWTTWEIKEATQKYEKADARTVHFPVTVGKDGETTITYTVHYTW